MRFHHIVMTVVICMSAPTFGATPTLPTEENPFPEYYKVNEKLKKPQALFQPHSEFETLFAKVVRSPVMNLLHWTRSRRPLPLPPEKYDRQKHFGRWVSDPTDDNCWNTRAKVLIRDSEVPVTFKQNNKCVVETGRWQDPYTGRTVYQASELQIDHFVPLKNSYISGGWQWQPLQKCMYANFISNDFHLAAVDGRENMRKGDKTPERYMPPNDVFTCDYLARWLKVKLIWSLAMQPGEATAIAEMIDENACDEDLFLTTVEEISRNRRSILEDQAQCRRMASNRR